MDILTLDGSKSGESMIWHMKGESGLNTAIIFLDIHYITKEYTFVNHNR